MRLTWILTLAALSAGALGSYIFLTSDAPTSNSRAAREPGKARVAPQVIERHYVHTVNKEQETEPTPPAEDTAKTARDNQEIPPEKIAENVEARFQRSPAPSLEARQFQTTVQDAFGVYEGKGATLQSVDCKEILCRVRVTFDDVSADIRVLTAIAADPNAPLRGRALIAPVREELANGQVAATLYFAREGDIEYRTAM